jgi:hypothetical protein
MHKLKFAFIGKVKKHELSKPWLLLLYQFHVRTRRMYE